MRILLPAVAALVPLVILPGFSFYFDITPKVVILLVLVAISLVFWSGTWQLPDRPHRWIALLLLLQVVWLAVASLQSTHPPLSLNGGNWRRFGLLSYTAVLIYALLVILDVPGRPNRTAEYLRAILLASIPISLYGIAQYFGLDPWLVSAAYHAGEDPFTIVRPPSTLGHANYFGSYLVYIPFVAYALTISLEDRFWRALAVAAGVLALAAIAFSGTRAAMLGLAVGVFVLVVRRPIAWRFSRFVKVAVALGVLVFAIVVSPAGTGLRNRIHWSLDEPLGGARPLLWRDSMQMASDKLMFGYGPETFGTEFPKFESVSLAKAYPDFQHESPHNVFLDALVSQGILGLLLLIAVVAATLYLALFKSADDPIPLVLGAAFLGAVVSQQFNVFTIPTVLFFYLFVALITASGVPAPPSVTNRLWLRGLAGLIALVFVAYAGQLAIFDRGLALTRNAITKGEIQTGLAHYQTVEKWRPHGSSADLYLSRELANQFRLTADVRIKLQTWTPAFRAAVQAVATSEERQNAFYNLAIFFATQNDAPNVERSLRNAIVWAPNWFKPHWTLAKLYLTQKRLPEAQKEAEIAADLNNGKDQEVLQTVNEIRAALAKM